MACFAVFSKALAQDQHLLSKKEIKELSRIFEGELKVSEVILADSVLLNRQFLKKGDLLFRISEKNENLGYILSTEAKGRYDYFDYSIYYSDNLVVMGLVVTTYRSSHGAAICQKKWLSQFIGYEGEELNLGKEIDAISGATFSAESLVKDMQRCHSLMTSLSL